MFKIKEKICNQCNGNGFIECPMCSSQESCNYCYNDRIIKCPECKGLGKFKLNMFVIESLLHWFKMRKFIKKYNGGWSILKEYILENIQYEIMDNTIKELPGMTNCSLCQKYMNSDCILCPLSINNYKCTNQNSIYYKTIYSISKEEWLKNSRLMIKALWDCRYHQDEYSR